MDAFLDWRFIAICLYPLFSSVVMMAFFKGEWVGYSWNREYRGVTIAEAFGTVVAAVLLSLVIWNTQRNAMFLKTEQINGVVSGKDTKLSTWRESYSCNCHTDSDGDRHCQTCYRTHYYKHFYLYNTSGDWLDGWVDEYKVEYSGSQPDENNPKDRRVPELWRNAWVGMPVSKDHQYQTTQIMNNMC